MFLFWSKTRMTSEGKCQKNVKEVSTSVKIDEIVCYLQRL